MAVNVIAPPAVEPITLDEAKTHCRVEHDAEDAFIAGLILAAREHCEGFQARAYVTQTLELTLDAWPSGSELKVPRPPLRSVTHIKFVDKDGVETTWDASNYVVAAKGSPGRIVLGYGKSWPAATLRPAEAIAIRYEAGYGDASAVPQRVKQAMLLLVGHWYENHEAVAAARQRGESLPIPFGVDRLLWPNRVFGAR